LGDTAGLGSRHGIGSASANSHSGNGTLAALFIAVPKCGGTPSFWKIWPLISAVYGM